MGNFKWWTQYSTVTYFNTVQQSTVKYSKVQFSAVQYSTVQYSQVQYIRVYPSVAITANWYLSVVGPVVSGRGGWCTARLSLHYTLSLHYVILYYTITPLYTIHYKLYGIH